MKEKRVAIRVGPILSGVLRTTTVAMMVILFLGVAGRTEPGVPGPKTVLDVLDDSKRVLWLAAHPDDETSSGALLARAKEVSGTLFMASLTKGENSDQLWRGVRRGTSMGNARAALFEKSAALLQADGWDIGPFINGPHALPQLDAMPPNAPHKDWPASATSEDVIAKWSQEGDPLEYIIKLLRYRRPDVVIAMDDHCGVSGHDEHIAVAKLLLRAIPLAAHPDAHPRAGQPWQVRHVIFSAYVTPQLVGCRYCKCEGPKPTAQIEEVFNLDSSETYRTTYMGVQCLLARHYQNAMEAKGWTDIQLRTGCEQAQAAAQRAYRPGTKGQPFFQSFRIRPIN